MKSLHLIVFNKLQGLDVKDFSGADDVIVTKHCNEYVNGWGRDVVRLDSKQ